MAETKSDIAGSLVPMSKQQAMIMLEAVYLWMDLGNFDHARDLVTGASALMPKTKQVQFALGTLEFNQQRYDKALQAFRAAQRLDPKSALARAHCAEALLFMGKSGEALKELQAAFELEDDGGVPDFAFRLCLFGGALDVERALKEPNEKKRAERYDGAVKAFQLAAKVQPAAAEPRVRLGEVYVLTGRSAEGRAELEAALKLSPTPEEKAMADKLLEVASGKVKDAPKKR
ncbi:MAG: tetratricopeptide repeat protein [Myxococcaceae bacterium]|nr:tetratricopeptide repeat protein [Myxococcaceae bacterium]MCA3013034.1 tetratricopeptide repeat protein [Myxococcaceae bacterium]